METKSTFGVIVGNRGFFPDALAEAGRADIIAALEAQGHTAICLTPADTKGGSVETRDDAKKCAALFKENADKIDGIIISLPNFGDEKGAAETIRMAELDVPVLIQATPDKATEGKITHRRDSFCGKVSVANNLMQYGIPFSLTARHTVAPGSDEFAADLAKFAGVCRVVKGFKNVRVGAIGARPASFNTVRYSERILERHGISVETLDLSELFGNAGRLSDSDAAVVEKVATIQGYMVTDGVANEHILRMAKLGVVIDQFIVANDLDITAIQCWTSMEENYGVVPCTLMSMMSNSLVSSACEVDVGGALSMHALRLASGTPSTILDWNNNYGDDPDKCVLFHCSNVPAHFIEDMRMGYQEIIAGSVGKDKTYGTCGGRIKAGAMTYARLSTDDENGIISAYIGEGAFTDDPFDSFGGYGVTEIPGLQRLMSFICENGFEHHVAASLSNVADILEEAFTNYLGFATYHHE